MELSQAISHYVLRAAQFVVVLMLCSCATPSLDVYYDGGDLIDPSKHQMFSIQGGDESLAHIPMINKGIVNALSSKGYRYVENGGDFVVLYRLNLEEGDKLVSTFIPINGYVYTQTQLEAVYEAKMLVNVMEAKNDGKLLWKASTMRDLTTVDTSVLDQDRINNSMSELFDSFPSR